MARPSLFKLFLVFLTVSYSITAQAQIETLATNDNELMVENSVKKVGNHILYATRLSSKRKIWDIDLTTGSVSILDSNIHYFGNQNHSNGGVFYTSVTPIGPWINGDHYLNFVDTLGNQLTPVHIGEKDSSIPNNYDPRHATICNNRYYVNSFYNNEHCIWESDGTTSGTQLIYQSPDPIVAIREWKDTLFIATEGTSDYLFSHYAVGGSIQQYAAIPKANFSSSFTIMRENDDHFYFRTQDSLNASSISRINFQNPPEHFLSGYFSYIDFIGNRFIAGQYSSHSSRNYIAFLSTPQQYDTIPFVQNLPANTIATGNYFGNGYFEIRSIETGIEFARLTSNDSIELIQTSVTGSGAGVPINVDGFNHYNTTTSRKFFTETNGNTYTVLTNGNDQSYYMYQLNGGVEKSLFKIDHPEDVTNISVDDGYIYWSEIRDAGTSIKRRNLSDPLETQPSQLSQNETWFQQFVAVLGQQFWDQYQVVMYLKDAELLEDGSAVVSLSMGEYVENCQFISSGSDSLILMNGSDIVVKYDKFGQLQWANGIGQKYGLWIQDNQFAVRDNGNIIVCGRFYHDAYFDSDTIQNPNSATYTFLAELDGNTGQIIWKKFIYQDPYYDTFVPEGIVIDENDNIYIAANFYGSGISIDGEYISSESVLNKTNSLSKFDPTGNIIWIRSCETPFTNDFGSTQTLNYSEEFQTISLSQSQGDYGWVSSCEYQDWKYYIQEWDVDGNKKSGIEIVGSDLGSLVVSTRTDDDQFFGMGYFRGTLAIDNYAVESMMGVSCHKTEGFGILYDGEQDKITSASTTPNKAFFPLDLKNHGEFIYVLGTTELYQLTLFKYSKDGEYIGYKPLNQFLDPSEWSERDAFFDINEDHILVEGINFKPDTSLNVRPLINIFQSVSVLKTTNSGWIEDDSWTQDAAYVYDEIDDLLIYPNPFSNEVNVYFPGTEVGYDSYQIVDINGRLISKGKLSEIQCQNIQFPEMRQGVYLITFAGESGEITEQLIKM